jgi:hypothetical protein
MKKVCVWMVAASLAAILGVVQAGAPEAAGEVDKIVDALKAGDKAKAKKLAAAYAKKAETVEDAMDLFKRKDKGGYGFGAGPKELDGIEAKLRDIANNGAKDYSKNPALYEKMAYRAAAIGLVAEALPPSSDKGMKTKKAWANAVTEMLTAAEALSKAKNEKDAKATATKLNNSCTACHSVFRTN